MPGHGMTGHGMAGHDKVLVWRERAGADRMILFGMISQRDTDAAIRIDESIEAAARAVLKDPAIGSPGGSGEAFRVLAVPGTRFALHYRALPDAVQILRVLHRCRLWPEDALGRI